MGGKIIFIFFVKDLESQWVKHNTAQQENCSFLSESSFEGGMWHKVFFIGRKEGIWDSGFPVNEGMNGARVYDRVLCVTKQ